MQTMAGLPWALAREIYQRLTGVAVGAITFNQPPEYELIPRGSSPRVSLSLDDLAGTFARSYQYSVLARIAFLGERNVMYCFDVIVGEDVWTVARSICRDLQNGFTQALAVEAPDPAAKGRKYEVGFNFALLKCDGTDCSGEALEQTGSGNGEHQSEVEVTAA
jgi:hypothetical protein